MNDDDPLVGIFGPKLMDRIRQKAAHPASDPKLDDYVAVMLGHDDNRLFQEDLTAWFAVAEAKGCADYFRHELSSRVNDRGQFERCCGELAAGFFVYRWFDRQVDYRFGVRGADLRFAARGHAIDCEVKTATGGWPPEEHGPRPVASPAPAIRELLDQCLDSRQLTKGNENLLLIVDWRRPPVMADHVVQALYGTHVLTSRVAADGSCRDWTLKRERDGKAGPNQMTRLGALGVLQRLGIRPELCAYFVHNVFAARPVAPEALDPWSQLMGMNSYDAGEWRNQEPDQPVRGITEALWQEG